MNYQELYDSINKGVPNYVMVPLNTDTIIRECASDRPKLIEEIHNIKRKFEQDIIEIMGFDKYRGFFFKDLRILTSYKTAESTLHISPITYLQKLKMILGVDNPSVDFNDLNLKQDLLNRLEVLHQIQDENTLQKEFPIIYKDYFTSKKTYQQLINLNGNPTYSNYMNYEWQMYNSFGFDDRFDYFLARQYHMYRNFIVRRQFVEGLCNKNPLDFNGFTGLDKERFEFYVAYKYLDVAKHTEDEDIIQKCVYYLMTYFRESTNYHLSIKGDRGENVTYRKLLSDFKKILGTHKNLKPIDEDRSKFTGYHIKHVMNHLNKYYGNMVNWYIVPSSPLFNTPEGKEMVLGGSRNVLSADEKERRIMKRMALYNQKVNFYENSGYVLKVFGWNEFNGYVCYMYPNGKIIMDKLFEDYIRCIPAKEQAIYCIEAKDFERLSQKSKQELMHSDEAIRRYHAGDWEGKNQDIIDSSGDPESIQYVRRLEKVFKQQKSNS